MSSPTPRRQPNGVPATFQVAKLSSPAQLEEPRRGRRRKATMPPLPQELLDGMTELERQHFQFFLDAHHNEYGDSLNQADEIALMQAAIEYINLLRVQADQLATGKIISMARQHPGVQLRQWLDSLSVTRKQRQAASPSKTEDKAAVEMQRALLELSKAD